MEVCISTNQDNIIIGYATIGSIESGQIIEVDGIPDDLCKGYYKLIDGEIVLDEELKSQIAESQ